MRNGSGEEMRRIGTATYYELVRNPYYVFAVTREDGKSYVCDKSAYIAELYGTAARMRQKTRMDELHMHDMKRVLHGDDLAGPKFRDIKNYVRRTARLAQKRREHLKRHNRKIAYFEKMQKEFQNAGTGRNRTCTGKNHG